MFCSMVIGFLPRADRNFTRVFYRGCEEVDVFVDC